MIFDKIIQVMFYAENLFVKSWLNLKLQPYYPSSFYRSYKSALEFMAYII